MESNTPALRVAEIRTEIESLDSEINGYRATTADLTQQVDSLRARLKSTDHELRNNFVSEKVVRERRGIGEQISKATAKLQPITEALECRLSRRRELMERIAGLTASSITAESLGFAVQSAKQSLATIRANRPAVERLLKASLDRHGEVTECERIEADARAELDACRADAFLLPPTSTKRSAALEAVIDADKALSVARERASIARAALPRITASIEEHQARLVELDAEISKAREVLAERERALKVWLGKRDYGLALELLRSAVELIEAGDDDLGRTMRDKLRVTGIRTFSKRGFFEEAPAWLRHGFGSL